MRAIGYIKVYRDLLDHELMASDWLCRLWIWCMLKANHKPRRYRGELIHRGQFVTGRNTGADQLKVSPSKFYRGLKQLADLKCLTLKVNSNWTTVTICNYTTYQDKKTKSEQVVTQQVDSKRTGDDTASEHLVTQRMNTTKECKEYKEGKEGKEKNTLSSPSGDTPAYPDLFESFWSAYPKRNGMRQHKVAAFKLWKNLGVEDRKSLVTAATNYAISKDAKENYACDPDRFLRNSMWHDWQAPPETPESNLPPLVVGPDFNYLEYVANFHATGGN
jgi:hypothetical protein